MLSGDSICPSLNTRTVILMNKLPINPEHLPAVITALRADDVAYLNIGRLPNVGPGVDPRPVSVWGALADAECETCHGLGYVETLVPDGTGDMRCPDCHDGKPSHTLTVECNHLMVAVSYQGRPTTRKRCIQCLDTGTVSVDVVVAELVPVYGNECSDDVAHFCHIEGWTPEGKQTYHRPLNQPDERGETETHVTPLGPPLQPSDWVAVLRTGKELATWTRP